MTHQLRPGNLKPAKPPNPPGNASDYTLFANSMAEDIENELAALMDGDGLPPLSTDLSDQSVRDRRRFIVAIARGVVKHIAANPDAFVISTNSGTITAEMDHITTV